MSITPFGRSARLVTALIACVALTLTACGKEDVDSGDTTTVRMATFGINNFSWLAGFAIENGFFSRNGIEIEETVLKSAPIAVSALAGDSVDVIEASPLTTMPLIVQGQSVTMISGEANNPFVFVVRKGIDVRGDFEDWMPKVPKIGVSALGSSGHFLAQATVAAAGLDDSDVQYVAVGSGPEGNAALDSGKIDALLTVYPYVSSALDAGHQARIDMTQADDADDYPESISWLFGAPYIGTFVSASFAEENPETVEAMQLSLMEASCFVNKPENLPVFAQYVKDLGGVPESVKDVESFVADSLKFSASYSKDTAERWNDFAAKTGGFTEPPSVDDWYGTGIAQDDADIASLVEQAGGSCDLPDQE